jgi:NADPH-dependent glutamate synthase beta subunit-like oxidoreductase/NAD(P)H-flavin reductase
MREFSASSSPDSTPPLTLGIEGFSFEDLYRPKGLERLSARFDQELAAADAELFRAFDAYRRAQGKGLTPPAEADLLIRIAEHVSRFVLKIFGAAEPALALRAALTDELRLFAFKREFITRRVFKKGAPDRPGAAELPELQRKMDLLVTLGFQRSLGDDDPERVLAECVLTLLDIERVWAGQLPAEQAARAEPLKQLWNGLRAALVSTEEGKAAFGPGLATKGTDADELTAVRTLLSLADRWTFARTLHPEAHRALRSWATHALPKNLDYQNLVELKRPDPSLSEATEGPQDHRRRRDGFELTDRRFDPRHVVNEVDYCVICHEREKDSCTKGFRAKDPQAEGGTFKKNPLGIPLTGCPLDERISEAHALKARGDSLAALAMVMLDNPMVPGTGHRICNDCMKACIFQKQEPVNIPQIETSMVTDVLRLPYGFEMYGLLTRWNPLNIRRPHPRPYVGKNVLVVGLGPAGYTLAHYLLNEGFGVVGIDGLKIEPFPDALTGKKGFPVVPIRDFDEEIGSELDERILAGFGGVSEYGITVRWDKNFLTLVHLTLARREGLAMYGGVRFGGTMTLDDAWELGFDHIAIATGAGKPTLIGMKNNLIRGIRKASDFLMALQLTGAFKKDAMANLQVRLPALVIGGGLTAIDTATELMAYYPAQVEKVLARHEALVAQMGEERVLRGMDSEERGVYETFLAHGRQVRAERDRAREANEAPDFAPLVRSWGGVSICYRRTLTESPAYRLNHEEVIKAFEEGIRFVERMSPVEALADENGAVRALSFERMTIKDGKLKGSGEHVELPARTVCVAAGTSPNVTYEREHPGTFALDEHGYFFKSFDAVPTPGGFSLQPVTATEDLGAKIGFFTSYEKDGKRVTFYGDNHPTYAGNVVKAMASAKDGYPEILKLFEADIARIDFDDELQQRKRDQMLRALQARLDDELCPTVVAVNRLTHSIVEVVVRAPAAARRFHPGQFYRLQNYETVAERVEGTRLTMEGIALTGAWVDCEKGLLSLIVLEMGVSSRLCAALKPGEPVVVMGPTGAPTEIPHGETVVLAGGGLGNAVLFSIAKALKAAGCRVLYFAGYKQRSDLFKQEEIEASTDQVIWSVDQGEMISSRRPQDATFRGNIVQAMVAYAEGRLGVPPSASLAEMRRLIAIGSDRMMRAVKDARHGVLAPFLSPQHEAIGSINSPMQCMMKEICAQCLQRHVDPATGKESFVFSCFNQDQRLDQVDFANLGARLRGNTVLEKQSNLWLDHLFTKAPHLKRI